MKKNRIVKNVFMVVSLFIFSVAIPISAIAADYPKRPITIIVPYAAGGSCDIQARMLAAHMKTKLGQPVNVVNKPGGGGAIGMVAAKAARPDGYTIILSASGPVSVTPFRTNAGFDPLKDYEFMAQLSSNDFTLNVNSKSGITTFKEWAEIATKDPAKATYATPGAGLQIHLVMLELLDKMNLNLPHVPYNGASEAIGQLLGEHVFSAMVALPDSITQYEAGTINTLAIASDKRHPNVPNVPTIKEQGVDVVAGGWFVFMAPKGTPKPIIEKLNSSIAYALEQQDVKDRYEKLGLDINFTNPEAVKTFVTNQCKKHSAIVKKFGL